MKKYTFDDLLICLYICIVVYLCYGYFYSSPLKAMGVYEFIEVYFGRSIFLIAIVLFIDFCGLFIKCRKKKGIFNVRFTFLIILILTSTSLYFAKQIGIPFEKIVATPEQLHKLTEIGLYKYKIGLFFVFLLDWLFDKAMGLYIYIVGYILLGISLFFLLAKAVRISIMWVVKTIRRKQRERRERKLYEEQKKLEEYYRRIEEEKEIARQKQLELEAQIEKERALMEAMNDENLEDDELEDQEDDELSEESKEFDQSHKLDEIEELEDNLDELDDSIGAQKVESSETDEEPLDGEFEQKSLEEEAQEKTGALDDNSLEKTEDATCENKTQSEEPDIEEKSENSKSREAEIGSENSVDESNSQEETINNKDLDVDIDSSSEKDFQNKNIEAKEKDLSGTSEKEDVVDEESPLEEVEDELEKIKKLAQEKEEKADDTSL